MQILNFKSFNDLFRATGITKDRFYRAKVKNPNLTDQEIILKFLKRSPKVVVGKVNYAQIARELGVSRQAVWERYSKLLKNRENVK